MRKINIVKPMISEEELRGVEEVLRSGMIAEGVVTREFEEDFAKYVGTKHAIFVNNGTTALHLALESLKIPPGSEIITSAFTFIASPNSISFVGAIPIFVEIDRLTFNIDPYAIEKLITPKTKAIMPVHIFGFPANMPIIQEIAEKHDLQIIEDAAQGHGGKIENVHVGSFGDVACFSFYATKNMITGEGGMLVTDNDEVAEQAKSIKNHGRAPNRSGGYEHLQIGYNFRAPDYSAAIGKAQLKKLDSFVNIRMKNANYYRKELEDLPLRFQEISNGFTPGNYILAPYLTSNKLSVSHIVTKLRKMGIMARPIYDTPVYRQPAYKNIHLWRWARAGIKYPDYNKISLPITELIAKNHFEIPIHPGITKDDADYVIQAIKEIFTE